MPPQAKGSVVSRFKPIAMLGALLLLGLPGLAIARPATPPPEAKAVVVPPSAAVAAYREDLSAIRTLVEEMMQAANKHNLDGVMRHYAKSFVSSDGLSWQEMSNLVKETWESFPDIAYESDIDHVEISGDWAWIESTDRAQATTASTAAAMRPSEEIATAPGRLVSETRGILYLQRIGASNKWEVVTEHTLSENAMVVYGEAARFPMRLSAPTQVLEGDSYSANVLMALPPDRFAVASIARNPITYPQPMLKERFRTVTPDRPALERVFEANETQRNELLTATVGIARLVEPAATGGEDEVRRPGIQMTGVATLVRRVNVVPKAASERATVDPVVRHSASGLVDLTQAVDELEGVELLVPAPEVPEPEDGQDEPEEAEPVSSPGS